MKWRTSSQSSYTEGTLLISESITKHRYGDSKPYCLHCATTGIRRIIWKTSEFSTEASTRQLQTFCCRKRWNQSNRKMWSRRMLQPKAKLIEHQDRANAVSSAAHSSLFAVRTTRSNRCYSHCKLRSYFPNDMEKSRVIVNLSVPHLTYEFVEEKKTTAMSIAVNYCNHHDNEPLS